MAVYFSTRGNTGALVLACLKAALDNSDSTFMIHSMPPYIPIGPNNSVDWYVNFALGSATIPLGSFVLSGTSLVYTPSGGGLSVPIDRSGRASWFLLEIPPDTRNLLFWPGTGEYLTAGQEYVITSISIPLAES